LIEIVNFKFQFNFAARFLRLTTQHLSPIWQLLQRKWPNHHTDKSQCTSRTASGPLRRKKCSLFILLNRKITYTSGRTIQPFAPENNQY